MILALSLISCSKSEYLDFKESEEGYAALTRSSSDSDNDYFLSTLEQRKTIAEWLAKNYTLKDAQKVHQAVTKAHSLGLDEVFFLRELSTTIPSANKITNDMPTELSRKFSEEYSNPPIRESSSVSSANIGFQHILNEYLQIYWPYSENWDMHTTPIIVYAPDNINSLTATGYKGIESGTILSPMTIDEKYCETHPVWIINESETPYSDIPNFNLGEVHSSDGVLYSAAAKNISRLDSTKLEPIAPVMTLKLGKVKSTKNHDSFLAGGSEYEFHFAYLKNTNLSCEADTSKCERTVARIRETFSRSEIKSKTTKELNSIAISDWNENLKEIVLKVIETDPGGKNKTFDAKVILTWKGKDYGFDVSIPFTNRDDEIGEREYTRNYIRSTNNKLEDGSWVWDYSDGVYWTLPYQIGYAVGHDYITP